MNPRSGCYLIAVVGLLLGGCNSKQAAKTAPVAPAVTVSRPVAHEVQDWDDYAGRLQSPETVNVTARVSGLIEKVQFTEGALVHKGDELFVIDDRPFKADLESKRATVQKDEAQVAFMQTEMQRATDLLKRKVVAQQNFDTTKTQSAQAGAQLDADKAAEETARLNLEWTRVTAPIDGRISRMYVTAGNQVWGAVGQATLLTTIVSVDPMYCYVSVPERAFLQYQQYAAGKNNENVHREQIPCHIGLESEKGFPHEGIIDFIDNAVDPNTGTIQMRGRIPNPTGFLTPGTFARMRIARSEPYKALLVPDKSVGAEQNEKYLLVVGADGAVASRTVKTGALFGSLRVILEGLKPDDRVVVNGMQKAAPGEKVTPQETPVSDEVLRAAGFELPSGKSAQIDTARP